jgi:hypothetical protein
VFHKAGDLGLFCPEKPGPSGQVSLHELKRTKSYGFDGVFMEKYL